MNNVVLMFPTTDEKTPYEQGENRTVILFRLQPRDLQFINFLNVPRHEPSLKEYERVYCKLYVQLRSGKDSILHGNLKKPSKASLKTVNHDREGIYTSFKLDLSAFTEVVQQIEALTIFSNTGQCYHYPAQISIFTGAKFNSRGNCIEMGRPNQLHSTVSN